MTVPVGTPDQVDLVRAVDVRDDLAAIAVSTTVNPDGPGSR
jgi:hypothetical protein